MSEPVWVPLGAAPAPPTSALELIEEKDLSSGSVFATIPQTYDTLLLRWMARSVNAVTVANWFCRANGLSTNVYEYVCQVTVGTGTASAAAVNVAEARIGDIPGASAPAGRYGTGELKIPGYADSGRPKQGYGDFSCMYGNASTTTEVGQSGVCFLDTNPLTALSFVAAGGGGLLGRAWLYGVRGA
jgi:hypothetical protein